MTDIVPPAPHTGRPPRHDPWNPHEHTRACWWDHREARMICPADRAEPPLVDTRDMIVVHTALLREFRLAPGAVARPAPTDRRGRRRVAAHLRLIGDLLHHHHTGEDTLLWPPLRAALPPAAVARLDEAQAQHEALDAALDRVTDLRDRWAGSGGEGDRDLLCAALRHLHTLLAEHLDTEERELLPLAAAALTDDQWAAVGAAGAAAVPRSKLLLVFGMFWYEGDPDVLAAMLHEAPGPVRAIVPRVAPRVYARYARRVHGRAAP